MSLFNDGKLIDLPQPGLSSFPTSTRDTMVKRWVRSFGARGGRRDNIDRRQIAWSWEELGNYIYIYIYGGNGDR